MRILQLVDSLNPGGAERMALNYFLALKKEGFRSYLVTTREEGLLSEKYKKDPNYYFLKKNNALDVGAFHRLKKFIFAHKIGIIHAHSSSVFWAALCKLSGSKVKIIWHDHYGNSEFLDQRDIGLLKIFSRYFDGIITVNEKLRDWAREKIQFQKSLIFLSNFVNSQIITKRKLKGNSSFKLICVANLRSQKDHMCLIHAFEMIVPEYDISLHLFGKNFNDHYSKTILEKLARNDRIFYYGENNNISSYLADADIGLLTSKSEGLPLAILEYGMAGLSVVSTDVGEIARIANGHGILVPPGNSRAIAAGIEKYFLNPVLKSEDSINLKNRINRLYSESAIIKKYLKFVQSI